MAPPCRSRRSASSASTSRRSPLDTLYYLPRRLKLPIQQVHPGPRMSEMVIHNDTVYLAGQIADDGSTDVESQTRDVLRQIDALLAEAGTDKSKLLTATIFLADIGTFAEM